MSVRGLARLAAVKGVATPTNAPIYVDSATSRLKFIPAGSGTTELEVLTSTAPVNITAATASLTKAAHSNRLVTLNLAAGQAITLPAATGSGDEYTLVVGTTYTGASTVAVASATDFLIGHALMGIDGGTAVPHLYPTANTGTVATESDTVSMFGTANSTGGIKGARLLFIDIAAATWNVFYVSDAGGTEATPFSAAV